MEQQADAKAVASINREVSIDLLKASSAYAVRTPYGQKDPGHFRWDPKNNSFEESQKTIYHLERADDNLGIHLFGRVVDIDVDTPNPTLIEALDYFLPYTAHVYGRKSRPRSHRLYEISGFGSDMFDPADYRFLQMLSREGNDHLKLELRGGDLRSGRYSLLPGSTHPSGELYEWSSLKEARSTPTTVDVHRLMRAVRFSCVAAAIIPYWTEGQRNALAMALSGFMHRAVTHMTDLGEKASFIFEKEDAKTLLRGICEMSGDDESDLNSRMKTFDKTWEKADNGDKVKGATALAEIAGDDNITTLLYTLLIDSPALKALDDFMDRFAIRNNTSNIIDRHRTGHRGAVSMMTMNDFHNSTMHLTVDVNGSKAPMSRLMVASTRATRVEGLCFIPEGGEIVTKADGEKYINQWRGFAIPPTDENVSDLDIPEFIDYVDRVLSDGDPKVFEWAMAWMADLFKNPADKVGTAMVLVGLPGSGKSFLGSHVLRRMIGSNHSMQVNSIESLTGQFNSDSANQIFIQCDEALNSNRRTDANRLKSMITDPTRRIEPKNVNAYEVEDHTRYLFTSNERDNAISIADGQADRRYSVFDTSDDYAAEQGTLSEDDKREYWSKMYKWARNDENLAKLHRYFKEMKYDRDLIRRPLDTEARRRLQQHSQRGFDDWLMGMVGLEHPFDALRERDVKVVESYIRDENVYKSSIEDWPELVSYSRLRQSYELYKSKKGMAASMPTYNEQQIKQEFINRKLLPTNPAEARPTIEMEVYENGQYTIQKKRIRAAQFPSRDSILAYLERKFGFTLGEIEDVSDEVSIGSKRGPDF